MTEKFKKALAAITAICSIFGLGAYVFYYQVWREAIGADWAVYYTAISIALGTQQHILYEGVSFTAALNALFSHWFLRPRLFEPWLYPPQYLLFLLPFKLLSATAAYRTFLIGSFGLMASAVIYLARNTRERILHVLAAVLNPATAIVIYLGQNTFLTIALLMGGLVLAKKRPLIAGALLGALTYKPQFWLMVPVALIASREWKVLAATLISASTFVIVSVAIFGLSPWFGWLHLMIVPNASFAHWQTMARINGQSLYACAMVLGVGSAAANGIQLLGCGLSAYVVWYCYRKPFPLDLRIAVLFAATVIAAPHIMWYDMLLVAVPANLFLAYSMREQTGVGDMIIAAGLWLSPLIGPPNVITAAVLAPILTILFVLRILELGSGRPLLPLPFGINTQAPATD